MTKIQSNIEPIISVSTLHHRQHNAVKCFNTLKSLFTHNHVWRESNNWMGMLSSNKTFSGRKVRISLAALEIQPRIPLEMARFDQIEFRSAEASTSTSAYDGDSITYFLQ